MTRFVTLLDDSRLRVDAIWKIGEHAKGHSRALYDADGVRLGYATEDEIAKHSGTIIPANPGWRICILSCPEEPFSYWFDEIIGWRMDGIFSAVWPITVGGEDDINPKLIVSPEGRTTKAEDRSWDTLEEALKELRAERLTGT